MLSLYAKITEIIVFCYNSIHKAHMNANGIAMLKLYGRPTH